MAFETDTYPAESVAEFEAIREFFKCFKETNEKSMNDERFGELQSIFKQKANIHLNRTSDNPLSLMEMVTVALATSLSISDIAVVTLKSPNSVKTLIKRAGAKLNTEKKSRAVFEALKKGYISFRKDY